MKRTLLLGAALCATLVLTSCESRHSTHVVAIMKTKTYHTAQCPRVKMALTKEMPVAEAYELKLKPCPNCKPITVAP